MKKSPPKKTKSILKPLISIIMGSDSDLKVMQEAAQILDSAQVPYEIKIVSAHRTPQEMQKFAKQAHTRGIRIIIAGAGGAAHLPGMVASLTLLPVIGVPIQVGNLEGLDALLSIAQMPRGVPVATMAVDNAANAGLMALRILALQTPSLQQWLKKYREGQKLKVRRANEALNPS